MLPISMLVLLACSTPEDDALAVGLAFVQAQMKQDVPAAHAMACAGEREAKPLSELLEAKSALDDAGVLGAAAKEVAEKIATEGSIVPTATVLDEAKASGTLHYDTHIGDKKMGSSSIDLRREGGSWCTVPGWALEKQVQEVESKLESMADTLLRATEEFRFDEAETAIADAQSAAAALDDENWSPSIEKAMAELPKVLENLADMKSRNVGGRWLVTVETDPMTDASNVVAVLASTNKVPGVVKEEQATLFVRCSRGSLDVFVATPFVLDSDWRYDSVPGQYRFGSEPAQRLRATRSKGSKAAFFRDARSWTGRLVEHQAEKWTIELSPYNAGPAAFFFDLTAADKAMAKVLEACPR